MIKIIYYINIFIFIFINSKILANTDIDSLGNPAVKPRFMLIILRTMPLSTATLLI